MLTSRPVQGSRSMLSDISAARCKTPSTVRMAAISCGSRKTSPATILRRGSPSICLSAASEPCDRLSSTTTSAAPCCKNSSALAEPTRLAPPTMRKRPPAMASARLPGSLLSASGMWHRLPRFSRRARTRGKRARSGEVKAWPGRRQPASVAGRRPGSLGWLRGGSGMHACSGDMLLEALVACAGVTLTAVATALQLNVRDARIRAEGDLDFRGTLGVAKEAPVGFRDIRLSFDIVGDLNEEQRATLMKLTERYCVVYQTLRQPPPVAVTSTLAV